MRAWNLLREVNWWRVGSLFAFGLAVLFAVLVLLVPGLLALAVVLAAAGVGLAILA